jgi:hypothetical protein
MLAGEEEVQRYMVQEANWPVSHFKGSYYMYESSSRVIPSHHALTPSRRPLPLGTCLAAGSCAPCLAEPSGRMS